MRFKVCDVNPKAEGFLPETKPDDSGVGINYATRTCVRSRSRSRTAARSRASGAG